MLFCPGLDLPSAVRVILGTACSGGTTTTPAFWWSSDSYESNLFGFSLDGDLDA